jgi:heptosyltransferase-1
MKILIVKLSSLGDLIHVFPVLTYLKETNPEIQIDWVVESPFAEMVRAHPHVNQVLTVNTKKWRSKLHSPETWKEIGEFRRKLKKKTYDLVLDLQGNIKSAFVTTSSKGLRKAGFAYDSVAEWPNLLTTKERFNPPKGGNIRDDYLFLAQSACGNFKKAEDPGIQLKLSGEDWLKFGEIQESFKKHDRPVFMVCPGSIWPNKQLSEETLRTFLELCAAEWNVLFVFTWGNQVEKEMGERLSATLPDSFVLERTSLPLLQNLMSLVDLVVAMDSLPLHLAGTTKTPTFSVFGPSSSSKYAPSAKRHMTYQGACPYGKTFDKRCAFLRTCKTGACMKDLTGKNLFDHLRCLKEGERSF